MKKLKLFYLKNQIIDAIFDILDKFIGEVKIEDDITAVVIKMQD